MPELTPDSASNLIPTESLTAVQTPLNSNNSGARGGSNSVVEQFAALEACRAAGDVQGSAAIAAELALLPPGTERECSFVVEALTANGREAEAAAFLAKVVEKYPDSIHLHHNLGVCLQRLQRLPEAFAAYQRAIELRPYSDTSLTMAGSVLRQLGRLDEALEFHGAAIRMNPKSAMALFNMGNALQEKGELRAAADAFRKALEISPDWEDLLNNHCVVLSRIDRFAESIPHLIKLAKLRNNQPNDLARLAFALRECHRPAEALEIAQILLQQAPNERKFRMLAAAILTRVGRSADAAAEYKKAIALNPELTDAYEALVYCVNYLPYEDPKELFEFHRKYSALIEQPKAAKRYKSHPSRPFPRKLRIGYVSGDYCDHPVASFIEPVLMAHDTSAFEVFCYYNFARVDPITERIRQHSVHWRQTEALSDEEFCEVVRADGIDILVDLSGHSSRNRLPAFALKPAPIQVTMIGSMQTTGLQSMDYRITDTFMDPVGVSESLHSERLIRMENGALCFKPHVLTPEVAPVPAVNGSPFTFGSYNNLAKLTPEVLDLWAKVLDSLPETRMQIIADSGAFFLREMQKRGIPNQRFTVLPRLPAREYLGSHAKVDLILDTFPFTGLTVSMNSLWMGVPMVTLPGNTSASRAGLSLLKRLDLSQFIAESPAEYLAKAAHFARNPVELVPVRESLRRRMSEHWANAAAYTRELEAQFQGMWDTYTSSRPAFSSTAAVVASAPAESVKVAEALETQEPVVLQASVLQQNSPVYPERVAAPEPVSSPLRKLLAPKLEAKLTEWIETADPSNSLKETLEDIESESEVGVSIQAYLQEEVLTQNNWKKVALCLELLWRLNLRDGLGSLEKAVRASLSAAADLAWYGRSLLRQERVAEAREVFEAACALPDVRADATLGLSCLLADAGEVDRAEALCRKTISMSPSVWESYLNLGNLLYRRGMFREALLVSEPAIRFSTEPSLLMNLAVYQEKCGEFMAAIRTIEKVVEKIPDSPAAFLNLGNCLLFLGMPEQASAAYRKSRQLLPDSPDSLSNYLHSLNYVPDADLQEAFDLHREYARRFEAPLRPTKPHTVSFEPERRLRIAYVSPDLRGHSVAYFVEPLLRHHNREQFEVWGVLSHTWRDGTTEKLKALCDGWLDAGILSHEALDEKLRELEVDVLVDLVCHSQGCRLLTFARKPAPLQITMIGMQQTTGLDSMDYRVTDAVMDPPGMSEKFHSEQLMRLPLAFCFQPPRAEPGCVGPGIAELPALKNGFVTFGSFNNFAKAHAGVLTAWAEVLKQVPNSRLKAVAPEGTLFEATMAAYGIEPERITVLPRKSHDAYLHMHDDIDFALDCFPFGGLTVSAIAAWMGVPTLTLAGKTPAARAGASLQHSLGLDEFIAESTEEYVRKAVQFASDLPRLAAVRASMRERIAVQLSDGEAYTRSFEREIREAWRKKCQASK